MKSERRVVVVTGASRGAGRAVALTFGAAGATVVVAGRSTQGHTTEDLPGSIDETADAIVRTGGRAVAVRCDVTVKADVDALFDRVDGELGGADVLVSNAWGGYEGHDAAAFVRPFWEQDHDLRWRGMFEAGLGGHLRCAARAARSFVARGRGLIVATVAWDRGVYLGALHYDVAKAAIVRSIAGMARELRPHGVHAVAVAPGFMRTERVLRAHDEAPFDLGRTESPVYLARALVALAGDPDVARHSGAVVPAAELARAYGVTDEDGTQPPPFLLDEAP